MSDKLQVQIGAEIKELQSKLAQAIKGLDKLKQEEKELTKAFKQGAISADKYYSSLAKNSTDLRKASSNVSFLKSEIGKLDGSTVKLGQGTANAVPALNEFSRVIQDAPFGIQGVANNITQLTSNFGYLSKSAGGAKNALKLMLGTLAGPAGILLGVSVVTSLLVSFGDKLNSTKNKTKELKDEQDKLTQSLEDYTIQLSQTSQAQLKGSQSAQKELLTLRALKSVAEDTNRSTDERRKAVKKLRDLYPDYLKNLTDEKILSGGLTSVYNQLTTSILKRAKATAGMNAIIKNSETLLTLESKLATEKAKLTQLEQEYDKAVKTSTASAVSGVNLTTQRTKKAVEEQRKALNALEGQIQSLELTNIDLEQGIDITAGITNGVELGDEIKEKVRKSVQEIGTVLQGSLTELQELTTNNNVGILTGTTLQFERDAMTLKAQMLLLSEEVRNIAENQLQSAFMGIGTAIGNAMSGANNLANGLGQVLLGAMGGLLTQLGQMAISVGVSLKAIKTALKSLNPAVAIGAGIALIALGSAFSSKASSLGNSIGGGSSGTNAGSNSSGGGASFSAGSSGGFGNGTVVFEIAGRKLVGVLRNEFRATGNAGAKLTFS